MRLFAADHRLKATLFAAAALSVLLLTGCGQKGDLYQPKSSLTSSHLSISLFETNAETGVE